MISAHANGEMPASLMTKREMIAMHVTASFAHVWTEQGAASAAVQYADALLAELAKPQEDKS